MVFETYKYKIISDLFTLAGGMISSQLTKPDYDALEKKNTEYYQNMAKMVKEERLAKQKKMEVETPPVMPSSLPTVEEKVIVSQDLTHEKIEAGVSCLPCSRDHFSTVSGALGEALRFARKEGVQHPEVQRRLGMALDELNMLERIDLSAESIMGLEGEDKELAQWGLNNARELRHKITAIRDTSGLEKATAVASNVRTEFMRKLWDVATVDGSIAKVCKKLSGEDRERCITAINAVVLERKQTPP